MMRCECESDTGSDVRPGGKESDRELVEFFHMVIFKKSLLGSNGTQLIEIYSKICRIACSLLYANFMKVGRAAFEEDLSFRKF